MNKFIALILTIIIVGALYGISWIATCGLIKLITMCFGMKFKWSIATGIWLIMCMALHVNANKD